GSVGGPTGVADAEAAGRRPFVEIADQVGNASGPLAQVQVRSRQGRQAGAVVASVFQAAQALNENRFRFLRPDVADNATHARSSMNPVLVGRIGNPSYADRHPCAEGRRPAATTYTGSVRVRQPR